VVIFTDGTSYTTAATITDPSTDPDIATPSLAGHDAGSQVTCGIRFS
jgi:hypothetical protein